MLSRADFIFRRFGVETAAVEGAVDRLVRAVAFAAILYSVGCGESSHPPPLAAQDTRELDRLRVENQEAGKLRTENQELARLRRDNQELAKLRGHEQEAATLRLENDRLRQIVSAAPHQPVAPEPAPPRESLEPKPLLPIQNLPQAFEEAALSVASQGNPREEDIPQKGDNLLIDQSVIALLIPEFEKNTNGGPYEISGWLTSRGVALKNYQQLNFLGITNYQVRRAPPPAGETGPK